MSGASPSCGFVRIENTCRKIVWLPQLAVSAKILCLLMVVIFGALPSMVRSVRFYNQCSHHYINIYANGTVMARADEHDQPNFTISTRGRNLELLIHSPIHDRFLCFKGGRLVGLRMSFVQAMKRPNCLFKEEFVNGYNRYHLAEDEDRYIGFNRNGVQIKRRKSRLQDRQHQCLLFLKDNTEFDINRHNQRLAGEAPPRFIRHQRRRIPAQNSIGPPCHALRHHHERNQRQKKKCDGT